MAPPPVPSRLRLWFHPSRRFRARPVQPN